ncbi:ABC transporter permease [Tepidibacter formicigenes]|jgi:peptide/nickel transport system permease protein|uniref:Peptide/nickel transport system permease protein n=1 Tax=Tepidibacter formicigenes DSM 15518 TaxID=1123349 RepID=A0A1M6MSN2_9FIRM|nr:ABC transporter permease [Tepidibacter formicigenes]SHJ86454.1 peptide/nickel transport system permease protein [Tepidibacter formicigenes DSM 15518]
MDFTPVGVLRENKKEDKKRWSFKNLNLKQNIFLSPLILFIITLLCILAPLITSIDPTYMELSNIFAYPCRSNIFGTDHLGRDVFARVLYGGRISITIGILSMLISTFIGATYGSISGYFGGIIDNYMMRFIDIMISIPSLLIMTLIQSILQSNKVSSIVFVIAITSWMNIAKIVRSEVLELKQREFVLASKIMGGNFVHIIKKHLIPNFMPAIIYMSVVNSANAIMAETTLSFLGLGLPIEIPSWGSMLMDAQKSILLNKWWVALFPGVFMISTIFCITNIGEYIRYKNNKKFNNI